MANSSSTSTSSLSSALEVRVRLLHAHATLSAGSTLRALVCVRAFKRVTLAWCAAQLSAHVSSAHTSLKEAVSTLPRALVATLPTLPATGRYACASPQTLLCAMLSLDAGDERSFLYECDLPSTLPVSHVGALLKCSHALHVQCQLEEQLSQSRSNPPSLRVPLRVLPPSPRSLHYPSPNHSPFNLSDLAPSTYSARVADVSSALPSLPLPPRSPHSHSASSLSLSLSPISTSQSFIIAMGGLRVGTWRLERSEITAGDALRATFDTLDAALTCYALSAALLQVEEATPPPPPPSPSSSPSSQSTQPLPALPSPHTQLVAETHVAMQHARSRSLALPLPRELTPSLEHEHVSSPALGVLVRYALRVRFVVARVPHDRRGESRVEDAASAVALEQLEWELPLRVSSPSTHALSAPVPSPALDEQHHDSALTLAPWHALRIRLADAV